MVKNYLKTALRNITKYKWYSTINIIGLAIGMTCCLLIMLWVFDELSFDKFHENDDKIYRVEQDQSYGAGLYHVVVTPIPLVPYLIDEIPEIVDATRYISIGGINIKYEDKNNLEYGIRAVDPAFLNIFTFPLEKGEKNTVLDDPYSIVISKEIAEKYFGDENPVGKILNFNNGHDLTVRGILGETKKNSFLQFDMLVSCEFIKRINLFDYYNDWGNAIQSYVLLNENGQIGDVDEKITIVRHNHTSPEEERLSFEEADKYESYPKFNLMKFSDIHLYGYSGFEKTMGFVKYVYIFSLIAIFVLLIACINFMNLSTARSAGRAKEIGMRKVSGAVRRNIVGQFYSETILQSVFAVSIAVFLTILILPVFNSISGKELSLSYLGNWQFITGLVCVVIITGIISGSYPALFL
ncbi:MAG: FtsX-like permease family protein, partial [bacterium]|nr:FtsX-like permease family protein [bacterium]